MSDEINPSDRFCATFVALAFGALCLFAYLADTSPRWQPQASPARLPSPMPPRDEHRSYELLDAHNVERAKRHLPQLETHVSLVAAARAHADHMAKVKRMGHNDVGDGSYIARVQKAGYHYHDLGENVAAWQHEIPDVMHSWMRSPFHRDNILSERYTQFGGAVAYDDDGQAYWCAVFGKPMP